MKPSERINQIIREGGNEVNLDGPGSYYKISKNEAIIQYLDEEYEKNKPCDHKNSYIVDSIHRDICYNVCEDCGVLFLAAQD